MNRPLFKSGFKSKQSGNKIVHFHPNILIDNPNLNYLNYL